MLKTYKYIKSFSQRYRKLSNNKKKLLNFNKFIIPFKKKKLIINNSSIIEIGFGTGNITLKISSNLLEKKFICLDIYKPGIYNILSKIKNKNIYNIVIINYNAIDVLKFMIPKFSILGIHIFFPDPWNKIKHKKRRLIQEHLLLIILYCLKKYSYLYFITDSKTYAIQIKNIILNFKNIKNITNYLNNYKILKKKYKLTTKFEKKILNININKKIYEFIYIKY